MGALHPSFMEGGYAPAKVTKATANKSESGPSGYYDVEFYDKTKNKLEPSNLIVLSEERYEEILKEILEKEGGGNLGDEIDQNSTQSTVKEAETATTNNTQTKITDEDILAAIQN